MSCLKLSCHLIHGFERKSSQRNQYDWCKVKKVATMNSQLQEVLQEMLSRSIIWKYPQPVQSSLSINLQTLGLRHSCVRKKTNFLCGYCLTVYWANSNQLYLTSVIGPLHFSFTKNELCDIGHRCPCLFGWPTFMDVSLDCSRIPLTYMKTYKQFSCKYHKIIMMSPLCWDKTWSILDKENWAHQ